ncbi:MAG: hypothetical protein DHS20C15_26100 [Planctomycetota bacterium]|nr:MAG: hypothetical protein DHS20C15_26100 [Planctomycetota bacterium]
MHDESLEAVRAVKEAHEAQLLALPNVHGVDVGYKYVGGQRTNEIVVRVFVSSKQNVPDEHCVPSELDGCRTDVIEEVLEAQTLMLELESALTADPKQRFSTLVGGISTGPCAGSAGFTFAGTAGALVESQGATQLLSNAHVLCVDAFWKVGNEVAQPAVPDGGRCPSDCIGVLEQACLGPNSNPHQVDAARATIVNRSSMNWILNIGRVHGTQTATLGESVRKQGRTTGLRSGLIDGLHRTTMVRYFDNGAWQLRGAPHAWESTAAMTSLDHQLYVVQNDKLWEANPSTGVYKQLGTGQAWSNTAAMTGLGGMLYIVQSNRLWEADPSTGIYKQLGTGQAWSDTAAMTSLNGMLYIVQGNKLWEANPSTGVYKQLGTGEAWFDTAAMTSLNSMLYVVQNKKLWEVDPATGTYKQLGKGQAWFDTAAMTSLNGTLYVVQNSKLWTADPSTGVYKQLGGGQHWSGTAAMTAEGNEIFVIQANSLWAVSGGITAVSSNQISISTPVGTPRFSDHGDSGSVVVSDDNRIVGLLYAGSDDGAHTVANPIADVFAALDVTLAKGSPGAYLKLGPSGAWADTTAMTTVGEKLYAVQNQKLWEVTPATGAYKQLGAGQAWFDTAAMTGLGSTLYIVQNDKLWKVDASTGTYEQLGTGQAWFKTAAMTRLNGMLYVVQNSKLWEADPSTGTYKQLGTGEAWFDTAAMTSLNGMLYVVQNKKLWEVDPATGTYKQLGKGQAWFDTVAMTAFGQQLYVVQNDKLWEADPSTGAYKQLGSGSAWSNTAAMTQFDEMLYVIQADSLWVAQPGN